MKASVIMTVATAALLVPSVWVFFRGANDEPYTTFRSSDAVLQIGVASALIALWLVWGVFVALQMAAKKLHRAWFTGFLPFALALWGLYQSPASYISDLLHFQVVTR